MADDAVVSCKLFANGQEIEDFDKFTENEFTDAVEVKLMNKTKYAEATPRYGFTLSYVKPVGSHGYDFRAVIDGTFVVEYHGGERVRFAGVRFLSYGAQSTDGENAIKKEVRFGATDRIEE